MNDTLRAAHRLVSRILVLLLPPSGWVWLGASLFLLSSMSLDASELEALARKQAVVDMVIAKEIARREHARTYQSLVLNRKHPISDLMKPSRYKVFYGGRGAVKSWGYGEALLRYVDAPVGKYLNRPERILCTREYQNSIKDSVHQLLVDTIDRMGLNHRFYITDKVIRNTHTSGYFIFKGLHHNVQEIKSLEGITKVWAEEAQSLSDESFEVLIPTIRVDGSELWFSFNVTDEQAPVYDRFVPKKNRPEDAIVHMINYTENPFFPEVLRREMEYMKKRDPDAYAHIWLGQARKMSNSVIFGKSYRVEGFPVGLAADCLRDGGRLFYGLDHGFAEDPYALIRFFIYQRKLYIEYEAFGYGTEFAGKMAPALKKDGEKRGELEQLLDTVPGSREWPIKADNSRPETISFLCGKGFNVTAAEKWKGNVEDGIAYIKSFDEIVIHDRCKHMQDEARLYSYKVDKNAIDPRTNAPQILPVVEDAHNHGWDAIRYGLDDYIRGGNLEVWAKLGASV